MTGPTPISSTGRVDLAIHVSGLEHHIRQYCSPTLYASDPTGWGVFSQGSLTITGLSVLALQWTTRLAGQFSNAGVTFDNVVLEERVGVDYVPRATESTLAAPTFAAPTVLASQNTWIFYTTTRKLLKLVLPETVDGIPFKVTTLTGLSGGSLALVNSYIAPTVPGDPGFWATGRDNRFVGSWLSVVGALNRKTRRRRGLA